MHYLDVTLVVDANEFTTLPELHFQAFQPNDPITGTYQPGDWVEVMTALQYVPRQASHSANVIPLYRIWRRELP